MHVNALFFLVVFAVVVSVIQAADYTYNCTDASWEHFKDKYKKLYDSSKAESIARFIFCKNVARVNDQNTAFANKKATYTLGMNAMADLVTIDESDKQALEESGLLGFVPNKNAVARPITSVVQSSGAVPPLSKDWVAEGKVSPVKNQGGCGSCWAHAVTGALESHLLINGGPRVSLSEQELVDCSGKFGNIGCRGGSPAAGFEYVKAKDGLWQGLTDPYKDSQGKCPAKTVAQRFANLLTYLPVSQGDEDELKSVIGLQGPAAVCIWVSERLQFYTGGVFSNDTDCTKDKNKGKANHAVLLVGYGYDAEVNMPYWLIKNSWGPTWGEKGYIRVQRGVNFCSVASYAVYPMLADQDYGNFTSADTDLTTVAPAANATHRNATEEKEETFEIANATRTTDGQMRRFAMKSVKKAVKQTTDYADQCEAIVDMMDTEYSDGGLWVCSVAAVETFAMELQDKQNAVVIQRSNANLTLLYAVLQQKCTPPAIELTVKPSNIKVNYGSYKVIVNDTDVYPSHMQLVIDTASAHAKEAPSNITKVVHDTLLATFGGYWTVLYGNISSVYAPYASPFYIWVHGDGADLVTVMNSECYITDDGSGTTTPAYDYTFKIVANSTTCTDDNLRSLAISAATTASDRYTRYDEQCKYIIDRFDKAKASDGSWICSISHSETYVVMNSASSNEITLSTTTSKGRPLYYVIREQNCTSLSSVKDVASSNATFKLGDYSVLASDPNYDHNQLKIMIDTLNADVSKTNNNTIAHDLYDALEAKFGGHWSILFGDMEAMHSYHYSQYYIWLSGPRDVVAVMNSECEQ